MSPTLRDGRLWLALTLPLLVIAGSILRAEFHLVQADVFHFEVAGYDPRDLLRGHYLRFSLTLDRAVAGHDGLAACDPAQGEACCHCLLGSPESAPPLLTLTTCEIPEATCDGVARYGELAALDRFYVPEAHALEAEALLGEARQRDPGAALLAVALSQNGEAQIVDLIVDGMPLLEQLGAERFDAPREP